MLSTDKKQTSRQSSDERLTYISEGSGRSLKAQAMNEWANAQVMLPTQQQRERGV